MGKGNGVRRRVFRAQLVLRLLLLLLLLLCLIDENVSRLFFRHFRRMETKRRLLNDELHSDTPEWPGLNHAYKSVYRMLGRLHACVYSRDSCLHACTVDRAAGMYHQDGCMLPCAVGWGLMADG